MVDFSGWRMSPAALLTLVAAAPVAAMPVVTISSCYDGDTCRTSTGEKIRLACIDTPELQGKRADPLPARAARDDLRALVVGQDVGIRRMTKDRYGRTVAELFVNGSNVQQRLVAARHAQIYWPYSSQCPWTR